MELKHGNHVLLGDDALADSCCEHGCHLLPESACWHDILCPSIGVIGIGKAQLLLRGTYASYTWLLSLALDAGSKCIA